MPKASTRKNTPLNNKNTMANLASRVDALMKRIPKGTARAAGARVGMAAGGMPGAAMGSAIGQGIAAITGYGDYKVRTNSLNVVGTSVDTVPRFVNNDHAVRMTHREFVTDLVVPENPTDFHNDTYDINPSNIRLFPWLSRMATQYQQYRVHGMVVEYKSMSSDYAASGPLGTVMIASNYNVNDLPYPTKVALENSEFAVSSKPSRSIIHAIECDPNLGATNRYYYVRDLTASGTELSDNRLYDLAKIQVATSGLPGTAGATMGEIWVSYDIEFTKPVLSAGSVGLVSAYAAVSAPTLGSPSVIGGRDCSVHYHTDDPLPDNTSIDNSLFQCMPDDILIAGDSSMDGLTTALSGTGEVRLYRNGVYTLQYKTECEFTSAGPHFCDNKSLGTEAQIVSFGTASHTLRQSNVVVRHYVEMPTPSTILVNTDGGMATVSVIVSGLDETSSAPSAVNFVLLIPPKYKPSPAAIRATQVRSSVSIDWLELKPTLMQPL
jgi:hypothetical protein